MLIKTDNFSISRLKIIYKEWACCKASYLQAVLYCLYTVQNIIYKYFKLTRYDKVLVNEHYFDRILTVQIIFNRYNINYEHSYQYLSINRAALTKWIEKDTVLSIFNN